MLQAHNKARSSRQATRSPLSDESLIACKQLREMLGGCSEMHIWRLLHDEKNQALAFPKPIKINDRNYWRLRAIRQWIRERELQSHAAWTAAVRATPRSKPTAQPKRGRPK
jgi:predicted DNA-binding transcriptional regulator AlpA